VLLLTFFCNLEIVSIYGMYKMVVNMVTSIVAEIGNSINFALGQRFNSEDESKAGYCRIIDVFNVYYSAISFALYTVTYILLIPFLRLYTDGMDINYIYLVLPTLYISMELLMVGREAMMRTIEVAGHFKKTQWRTLTEAAINLGASVIFIIVGKHYFGDIGGIYGVLLGTVAALLYRTIDMNLYANKRILHRSSLKTFGIMIANALLLMLVAFVFRFIPMNIDGYGDFILYGLLITPCVLGVFVTVQSILNVKECKFLCVYVRAKIKK
jgi:hypothetical protein